MKVGGVSSRSSQTLLIRVRGVGGDPGKGILRMKGQGGETFYLLPTTVSDTDGRRRDIRNNTRESILVAAIAGAGRKQIRLPRLALLSGGVLWYG